MRIILSIFASLISSLTWSQAGNLDNSFGFGGKTHTGFGISYAKGQAVAVQSDGKIIVGGSAFTANTVNGWQTDTQNATLTRYHADGSLDSTFGIEGVVMMDLKNLYGASEWRSDVLAIKILANGKILCYGGAYLNSGAQTTLSQYNSDGTLDVSFGIEGLTNCNSSPIEGGNTLIVQSDGKIITLGVQYLNPSPGVSNSEFVIERFSSVGTYDSTFATNGRATTFFTAGLNTPRAIAMQADGKIIAVGNSPNNRMAAARFTVNGILDNTFDGDGKITTSFGAGTGAYAHFVKIYPNGKILLAGFVSSTTAAINNNFAIAKYNTNGSLDLTFDGDGKALNPFDVSDISYVIKSLVEQSDGKLLVVTSNYSGVSIDDYLNDFVTRRYNSDVSTDLTFGVNGKVATTIQPGFNGAKNIGLQSDGKILVVGYSHQIGSLENDMNIVRYESNGLLDLTFDTDGKVSTKFDSSNDECSIALRQPNNKLIAIGTKKNYSANGNFVKDIALSRYNSEGSLDSSFGIGGKIVYASLPNVYTVNDAVLQADGKIVLSNSFSSLIDGNGYELIRFTNSGNLDTSFGTNGKVGINMEVRSVISQPDGKIITTNYMFDSLNNAFLTLTRYTNNGVLDISFDGDGMTTIPMSYSGYNTTTNLQADGKIIVSASSIDTTSAQIGVTLRRINPDGSLDNTFEYNLKTVDLFFDIKETFIQPNGKIIVTGRSLEFTGNTEYYYFASIQYNPNGSIDSTYGTNGVIKSALGSYYATFTIIQSVVLQPDGKFLVALTKLETDPVSPTPNSFDFGVFRFLEDGTYDNDFGVNGQVITPVYNKYDEAFSMVLQSDNKIVVTGTTDTGVNRDFALIRFENDVVSCEGINAPIVSNPQTICEGESYVINGNSYVTSGTYTDIFQTVLGCDSTVITTLLVNPIFNINNPQTICQGDSVVIGSSVYSTSGIFVDVLESISGCDSTVTTTVTINPVYLVNNTHTICEGANILVGGNSYSNAGTYIDSLQASSGCDSIVTTFLTVNPNYAITNQQTICAGEFYSINGNIYTISGTYTDVIQTVNGCDSIITTSLFINPSYNITTQQNICQGETISVGPNVYSTSGTYVNNLQTTNGCDSIVTTILTVNPNYSITNPQTICFGESYLINGNSYTTSGTYTHVFQTINGCDSTVVSILTVNDSNQVNLVESICIGETYSVAGNIYSASGIYTNVLQNILGCDSTVFLDLTVESPILDTAIVLANNSLSSAETLSTYQWFDCDLNQNILGATNQTFTPLTNGNYAVILTSISCPNYSLMSSCHAISSLGKDEIMWKNDLLVYPNPTNSIITVSAVNLKIEMVILTDLNGKVILNNSVNTAEMQLDLKSFSDGVYLLHIKLNDGERIMKRIVKQGY